MRKTLNIASLVVALLTASAYAVEFDRATTFEDAFKASCRVSVSNARGTGTFIGHDREKNRCVILTNYHVVTKNNAATLDFWTNGVRQSVSGKVYARYYDAKKPYDFALIEVDPDELAKINPPFVAPGGKGAAPDSNSYILSAGCPKGRFTQAWKGKVLGYYSGSTVEFQPAPVPGQSGSGVISVIDGELWLTAVLTWLIGAEGADTSKGGAIPIANLYNALRGGTSNAADSNASPIPPDATECIANGPYVVEFTRDDCAPCAKAEADVELLEKSGVTVVVYNTSTQGGRDAAKGKDIAAAPCFIVYDGEGVEISRYLGPGKAAWIIADVKRVEEEQGVAERMSLTEENAGLEELEGKLFNVDPFPGKAISSNPPAISDNEPTPNVIIPRDDFRNRAPVYENEDEETKNTGFFDDADACWRKRNGNQEENGTDGDSYNNQTPQINEDDLSDKIGGRLRDSLGNRLKNDLSGTLSEKLDDALDLVERRIEKKTNSKIEEIRAEIKRCVTAWKWRAAALILALVICGGLVAQAIAEGVRAVYRWAVCEEENDEDDEDDESENDEKTETDETKNNAHKRK